MQVMQLQRTLMIHVGYVETGQASIIREINPFKLFIDKKSL